MKEPISYKYIKIAFGILCAISLYSSIVSIFFEWGKTFITIPYIIVSIAPTLLQISILYFVIKIKDIRKFINGFTIIAIFGLLYKYNAFFNLETKIRLIVSLINIIIICYLVNTKIVRNWVAQNNIESKKPSNKELTYIFILYLFVLMFFSWIYKEQIKAKLSVENTYNIK